MQWHHTMNRTVLRVEIVACQWLELGGNWTLEIMIWKPHAKKILFSVFHFIFCLPFFLSSFQIVGMKKSNILLQTKSSGRLLLHTSVCTPVKVETFSFISWSQSFDRRFALNNTKLVLNSMTDQFRSYNRVFNMN